MTVNETYYDLLGVHRGEEDRKTLVAAYKLQAKRWHPDKAHAKDVELAKARFQRISEAYEVRDVSGKISTKILKHNIKVAEPRR